MKQNGKRRTLRISGYGLAVACALFLGAWLGAPAARAEALPKTSLAISPPLFELSANPGDTLSHEIRVDNLTDKALSLKVDRKDFVAMGEEGQAALTDKPTRYSLSSWIHPADDGFLLRQHASKTVKFTIRVPENAEPGGHFGSVVFKTVPKKDGDTSGLSIGQEIGALILLKVAGDVKEDGRIVSFRPRSSIVEAAPLAFETRFENTGNVQVVPSGTITVTDLFGRKLGDAHLESRTVLPGSVRKITTGWEGNLWPGWYMATVSLGYGTKGQLATASTSFFVFPYKIILPILVILGLVAAFAYRGRKRLARAVRILFGKE